MSSQFNKAKRALLLKNTRYFNASYGTTAEGSPIVKRPSQFELAKLALRSESPVSFNEMYGYSSPNSSPRSLGGKRRKTRKGKKARRVTRRRR